MPLSGTKSPIYPSAAASRPRVIHRHVSHVTPVLSLWRQTYWYGNGNGGSSFLSFFFFFYSFHHPQWWRKTSSWISDCTTTVAEWIITAFSSSPTLDLKCHLKSFSFPLFFFFSYILTLEVENNSSEWKLTLHSESPCANGIKDCKKFHPALHRHFSYCDPLFIPSKELSHLNYYKRGSDR